MADKKKLTWQEAREKWGEVIARHEGYYRDGSRAQRNNNPGNLKGGMGCDDKDGGGFCRFGTPQEGWAALNHQLNKIEDGSSSHYSLEMTPQQIVDKYANSSTEKEKEAYAKALAKALGIKPDQKIEEGVEHWVTIDGNHVLISE